MHMNINFYFCSLFTPLEAQEYCGICTVQYQVEEIPLGSQYCLQLFFNPNVDDSWMSEMSIWVTHGVINSGTMSSKAGTICWIKMCKDFRYLAWQSDSITIQS